VAGKAVDARVDLDGVTARFPNVDVIHTYGVHCDAGVCRSEWMGTPLCAHNDRGHLGAGGSAIYYRACVARRPGEAAKIFSR
jgi:hypothetical protein